MSHEHGDGHRAERMRDEMADRISYSAANKLADVGLGYVVRCGEAHPAAPVTPSIAEAIEAFDGSCEAEDRIWSCYLTAIRAGKVKVSHAFKKFAADWC